MYVTVTSWPVNDGTATFHMTALPDPNIFRAEFYLRIKPGMPETQERSVHVPGSFDRIDIDHCTLSCLLPIQLCIRFARGVKFG